MIAVYCIGLLIMGVVRLTVGQSDLELDIFYSECGKYENDLFGGPVCGSDGITYRNAIHLRCLNHHNKKQGGSDIEIIAQGSCPGDVDTSGCPWSPMYRPVCGTDGKTYVNEEWLMCLNNKTGDDIGVEKYGECHHQDPCVKGLHAGPSVCASNGFTFQNADAVRCLRHHHSDLEILHEGGCSVDEVNHHYPSRGKVCEISRHRHEFNPICGPKNITYGNPFIFLCSKPLAVAQYSGGVCNCSTQRSCKNALDLDKKYAECRKETELPEVCGSDGFTYRSVDHLICAARNNSQLSVLHKGPCTMKDSPCLRCKEMEGMEPVCGSDGVTYASFLALSCVARSKDPNLQFVHLGECINRRPNYLLD